MDFIYVSNSCVCFNGRNVLFTNLFENQNKSNTIKLVIKYTPKRYYINNASKPFFGDEKHTFDCTKNITKKLCHHSGSRKFQT